jgi:hypothetical protein
MIRGNYACQMNNSIQYDNFELQISAHFHTPIVNLTTASKI